MALTVQKYGGTSLADAASRELLAGKVKRARSAGDEVILVVSAMGRNGDPYATDTLLGMLDEFPGGADGLTRDLMASSGEVISACVIASLLGSKGIPAVPMTAFSAAIPAEGPYGDAAPGRVDPRPIRAVLNADKVPVITGFQGVDKAGNILTLGRGGSDTTAVAIGAALKADFVDIYKDVPGVAMADPKLVANPRYVKFLDYDSMFRLANHGARVLHDRSALLAKSAGLRVRVRSTFDEGEGTLIGPLGEQNAPEFLGLASSPAEGGRMKIVAVFGRGRGANWIPRAMECAKAAGAAEVGSGDPDAAAFVCDWPDAKALVNTLLAVLG